MKNKVIEVGQSWTTRGGMVVKIMAKTNLLNSQGSTMLETNLGYLVSDTGFVKPRGFGPNDGDLIRVFHVANDDTKHPAPDLAINPKDTIGSTKLPLHLWPAEATAMGCLGMLDGREKYGRSNMIAGEGVVASIYVDAAKRHLDAWFSGEEEAPDTGLPHLSNALATIAILVKCQAHGKLIDDRDYSAFPGAYRKLVESLTPHVKRIQDLFKDKKPRHFTIADSKEK